MCFLYVCVFIVLLYFWLFAFNGFLYICSVFPLVLWYCWLGHLTCKTVSQLTYTVFVETLNHAQSINKPCKTDHITQKATASYQCVRRYVLVHGTMGIRHVWHRNTTVCGVILLSVGEVRLGGSDELLTFLFTGFWSPTIDGCLSFGSTCKLYRNEALLFSRPY